MHLTPAQRLKFRLLAEGVRISPRARARLDEFRGERRLTPADYSSTSGLILRLDDDVWVNAPIEDHNPNFVDAPRATLDWSDNGFVVGNDGRESTAAVWLPPLYHGQKLSTGRPANHFTFTHGDRVRLSPLRGCAMRCQFCCIPYEDRYGLKPVDSMVEALQRAFDDPLQPAQHVLLSGGTPVPGDVPFLRGVYERVLLAFPSRHIDIMMVPVDGLLQLKRLRDLGVHELSINIELASEQVARRLMPQKNSQGMARYLRFITEATEVLGPGRVRSMIMVGLEAPEVTLRGIAAILDAGGVPVLSPFRPDPVTPLREHEPQRAEYFETIFLRATELAEAAGAALGPSCPPCTHNTLALVPPQGAEYPHTSPILV